MWRTRSHHAADHGAPPVWNSGTISPSSRSSTAAHSSSSRVSSAASLAGMVQPLRPSAISSHQPSLIEQLMPPLRAAFSPDVPDASWGRIGVLSHTSQPAYMARATAMS